MNTTNLLVEILIIGFQVFTWLSLIIAILFGYDWIPFASFKDWVAIIALFVIGASYTLGTIFDNLFFSLFENRRIANKTIKRLVLEEVTRKAMRHWRSKSGGESYPFRRAEQRRIMQREWNRQSRRWKGEIKRVLEADQYGTPSQNELGLPDEWNEALHDESLGFANPDWELISSRDPRQIRLYILAENEKLGEELEKYLNKAGLARGSSLNLVIIGVLSLVLYLKNNGFTLNVFLFGLFITLGFAVLAYNTWRQSALVYYYTLWDLLKLTAMARLKQEHERHYSP